MWVLVTIALAVACYLSVCVRVAVAHPAGTVWNAAIDLIDYLRYRKWRVCKTGELVCYVGLFGKGKTLSAVHRVCGLYKKYDGRMVYDPGRQEWVTQKVHVISNVDLSIPYERFTSLKQVVFVADRVRHLDSVNGTLTVTIILGDEFSVQLNSRSFKTNIDPLFLNTLLTCRHHHISLVYTSQRFNHVDALLRQVTSSVITCNKVWRFMVHGQFDAFELENAADPTLVSPLRRFGWFVRNRDYAAYDTLACVDNLSKSCSDGDMLTEEEILALQNPGNGDMGQVLHPSRKYVRSRKKVGN